MDLITIKILKPIFTENGESYFECVLTNNRIMEISFWSFYEYLNQKDVKLKKYSDGFDEWETLTNDLYSLDFDFKKHLNMYLSQFNNHQILEFSCKSYM